MKAIFVVGTAGAGKSLLTSRIFDYYTRNDAFVGILNLDPGVENLPYTCDVDVRDYVDIVSIMKQYDLGPNGAMIMASDLIASKIEQIQSDVDNMNPDYLLVDTPGQIELFAYRTSGPFFVQNFNAEQKVALFLYDGVLVTTPTNFVSVALLATSIKLRLNLPHINVITKTDLIEDKISDILKWSSSLTSLEDAIAKQRSRRLVASSVIVRAPCSTANLGPGFDVFGLALDAYYDEIQLVKGGNGIKIQSTDPIPLVPEKNSAGLVVREMAKKFKIKSGLVLKIRKGVPAGFGMGSSAASAAAAAVAFDALFDLNLDKNTLVEFAGVGEKASAGSVHYDNVSASIFGGFVIVKTNPLDIISIEPPKDLVLCVAIPKLRVPTKKTQVSRSVLPKQVKLSDYVQNLSNATAIEIFQMRQL